MDGLSPAVVERAWDETRELRGLRLAAPEAARTHLLPGQFLKVRAAGNEGSLALASAPGRGLELLVKRGGRLGDAVAALADGAPIETSEAQGKGYPVEALAGRDLILCAAGSGITPIRALLLAVLSERARFGAVTLFYGHRAPDDFAYRADHAAWAASGVELVKVVSRPPAGWTGATGHVQDALTARRPPVENAAAALCGMRGMVAGVTDALTGLGLPRERIHLNY